MRSPEEIAEYQLLQIRAIIHWAFANSPFYQDLYSGQGIHPTDVVSWRDFSNLPTVTKGDIIEHHQSVVCSKSSADSKPRMSRSSGSSGEVLEILSDSERWIKSALMMLRMYRSSLDFGPFDKGVLIYTSIYPYQLPVGPFRTHYINTLTPSPEIFRKLKRLRPRFVISYPSILLELAAGYGDTCKELGIGGISTNSEQSSQNQRDYLADLFGCPVFDEYSSEELILGGFQCVEHVYHLQEDCAYLEVLDVDSDRVLEPQAVGEITGTCLINKVTPFIRYRQGDLGSIEPSNCICGNNGRVLSRISGRRNSSFVLSDGRIVPSGRILDWTYKLILELNLPIVQFKVVQESVDDVRVIVVGTREFRAAESAEIIAGSFRSEFGDFLSVSVVQATRISRTTAGKHIPIQSLVKPTDH